MKKILAIAMSLLFLGACSKDKNNNNNNNGPTGLTGRLVGTWNMTALDYSTQVPNPLNPLSPIDLTGDAQDLEGTFTVTANPNVVVYNYSFNIVDADLPFPIPVQRSGQATWDVISNDTKVVLEENGESTIYDVITNEAARQIWAGTLPFTIPGVGITVDSDIQFTLERQ